MKVKIKGIKVNNFGTKPIGAMVATKEPIKTISYPSFTVTSTMIPQAKNLKMDETVELKVVAKVCNIGKPDSWEIREGRVKKDGVIVRLDVLGGTLTSLDNMD